MTLPPDRPAHSRRPLSPAARCAWLAVLAGLLYLLVAPAAFWHGGADGLLAAGFAAAICLMAGVGAIAVADLFSSPNQAYVGVLAGMMIRMAVPMLFCMIVHFWGGRLADVGLVVYVLFFYPAMLAVETWFSVQSISAMDGATPGSAMKGNG